MVLGDSSMDNMEQQTDDQINPEKINPEPLLEKNDKTEAIQAHHEKAKFPGKTLLLIKIEVAGKEDDQI